MILVASLRIHKKFHNNSSDASCIDKVLKKYRIPQKVLSELSRKNIISFFNVTRLVFINMFDIPLYV